MVIILTGAPASGKSTVAERLASCLDRAAHRQVDCCRKMVKGGYASPHHWNDEVDRQYRSARTSAAQTARNLAAAGSLPILDDIVPPAWVDEWRRELDGLDCRFVVLCPRFDVAQRRNRERPIWTVDETLLAELHAMLEGPHTEGWLVVDNSEGTVDDAVAAVPRGLALVTRACRGGAGAAARPCRGGSCAAAQRSDPKARRSRVDRRADQGSRELALLSLRAQEAQAGQASAQEEHRVGLGYAASRLEDGPAVPGRSHRSRIQ